MKDHASKQFPVFFESNQANDFQFKYIFEDENLLNNEKYIKDLKNNILNCGCISIKFTQWIVSKLKGSDNNQKYKKIIDDLEDLFENCNIHSLEYTKEIFKSSFKQSPE